MIHPDDFDASLEKFAAALASATDFEDEWRLRLADGSYRWVLSRAIPSSSDPAEARWFGTITDIDDKFRQSQDRELLAGELAHRIKNIFSVIIGLIAMHARGDETTKTFGDTISDTIRALSRAQEFALNIGEQTDENLRGLLTVLMAPYGVSGSDAVNITGDDVEVGRRATTPLALVFHELATNSAKYGALSVAAGRLAISIEQQGDSVVIHWQETGGPPTTPPADNGFGSRLIQMSISNQLGGTIEQDWREEGLQAVITVPSAQLAE